jgi:hypothetical protein
MAHAVDGSLDTTESTSNNFVVTGQCDLWVSGLTSGTIKFQIKFPPIPGSTNDDGAWKDFPEGSFSSTDGSSHAKTVFISEHGVLGRLYNDGGNSGVYCRIGRWNNK